MGWWKLITVMVICQQDKHATLIDQICLIWSGQPLLRSEFMLLRINLLQVGIFLCDIISMSLARELCMRRNIVGIYGSLIVGWRRLDRVWRMRYWRHRNRGQRVVLKLNLNLFFLLVFRLLRLEFGKQRDWLLHRRSTRKVYFLGRRGCRRRRRVRRRGRWSIRGMWWGWELGREGRVRRCSSRRVVGHFQGRCTCLIDICSYRVVVILVVW